MSEDEDGGVVPFKVDEWWRSHHGGGVKEDDSEGVCVISYSQEYVECMDYFRSVVRQQDLSPEVLPLLSHLLRLNPGNYSVWHYRRILLAALFPSLPDIYQKELLFVSDMAESHPKNYQIWYHRQTIVSLLFSPQDAPQAQQDLAFVATLFEEDAKNYHAWAYRQWVILRSNQWDQELPFIEDLLAKDIRNNSAWTQRHFVFTKGPRRFADRAVLAQEIRFGRHCHPLSPPVQSRVHLPSTLFFLFESLPDSFVISKMQKAPNNESGWNYLRGYPSFSLLPSPLPFAGGLLS